MFAPQVREKRPFIVYTAGNSRTYWLAKFLTYSECQCAFESAGRFVRSLQEAKACLVPGKGSAETLAAPGWMLVEEAVPTLRTVVVRRPVDEIIDDMQKRLPNYDIKSLRGLQVHLGRVLDRIALRPNALAVDYKDMGSEEVCKAIFEHCLPYPFDKEWWVSMSRQNVKIEDVEQFLRNFNLAGLQALMRDCRHQLFSHRKQMEKYNGIRPQEAHRPVCGEISALS